MPVCHRATSRWESGIFRRAQSRISDTLGILRGRSQRPRIFFSSMNYRAELPVSEQDSRHGFNVRGFHAPWAGGSSKCMSGIAYGPLIAVHTPEVSTHEKCFNRHLYSVSWTWINGMGSDARPAASDARSTFGRSTFDARPAPDARPAAIRRPPAEWTSARGSHESHRLSHESGFRSVQHRR